MQTQQQQQNMGMGGQATPSGHYVKLVNGAYVLYGGLNTEPTEAEKKEKEIKKLEKELEKEKKKTFGKDAYGHKTYKEKAHHESHM